MTPTRQKACPDWRNPGSSGRGSQTPAPSRSQIPGARPGPGPGHTLSPARAAQEKVFPGPVHRIVLGHDAERNPGSQFIPDPSQRFLAAGQIVGQHQVPDDQPPSDHPIRAVNRVGSYLAMHLPDCGPSPLRIMAHSGTLASGCLVRILEVGTRGGKHNTPGASAEASEHVPAARQIRIEKDMKAELRWALNDWASGTWAFPRWALPHLDRFALVQVLQQPEDAPASGTSLWNSRARTDMIKSS